MSTAKITYTYRVDNEPYAGEHKRTSGLGGAAEEYPNRLTPGGKVLIRYDPANSARSFVFEEDQTPLPVWATRYGGSN